MKIVIRPATEKDAAAISAINASVHRLHADAVPHFFKPPSQELFPPAEVVDLLNDPQNVILIAYIREKPAGYIYAEVRDLAETSSQYATTILYVRHLSVAAGTYSTECGAQLLDAIQSFAHDQGIGTIALDVWTFNRRALAFYEEHGFVPYTVRMWLHLDDNSE